MIQHTKYSKQYRHISFNTPTHVTQGGSHVVSCTKMLADNTGEIVRYFAMTTQGIRSMRFSVNKIDIEELNLAISVAFT